MDGITNTEVKFYWGTGIPQNPEFGAIYLDEENELMYICIDTNKSMLALCNRITFK